MIEILKKIITVGTVTQSYPAEGQPPKRFRGQLALNEDKCTACAACVESCPVNAITQGQGELRINHNACIFCGRCVERCALQALTHTGRYELSQLSAAEDDSLGRQVKSRIAALFGRSLHIRHLDAGSCNACDFEMAALSSPIYDLQQYGIDFVASPRHADLLMVTGVVTRNMSQAVRMTYDAMPSPKLVMAVGACAAGGQVFGRSYAQVGAANTLLPVDIYVPGCPPRPQALLYGLLTLLARM